MILNSHGRSGPVRSPQALFGDGPLEAILDEIVGLIGIAGERPCIAPQGGHQGLDIVQEARHDRSYSLARCQTPPMPSPLTSPGFLSPCQR